MSQTTRVRNSQSGGATKPEATTELPFPKWTDKELNSEQWELPKAKGATNKKKLNDDDEAPEFAQYVDKHPIRMPQFMEVHCWKRPAEVFPNATFVVYKDTDDYYDMLKCNRKLLHIDFLQRYISVVKMMQYWGCYRPWPMEGTSPTYCPSTSNDPWMPWHHVYSLCKAGKGQTHNPRVNSLGKYVIRLFWLGDWRRVVIDDMIPLDKEGHVMLPGARTVEEDQAKTSSREIQLWPFLLYKALLKVGFLSWTKHYDFVDFSILHSMTGWLYSYKLFASDITPDELWNLMKLYSENYTWPEDGKTAAKPGKKAEKGKGTKGGNVEPTDLSLPFLFIGELKNLMSFSQDCIPELTPCVNTYFVCLQTRDIPWEKPPDLPVLPRWKHFRWIDWAVAKGMWPNPNPEPIRSVKIICGTEKYPELLAPEPEEPEEEIQISQEQTVKSSAKSKGESSKAKSSDKTSKKSPKRPKALLADISFWLDFYLLRKHINWLTVIYKRSRFSNKIRVSDQIDTDQVAAKPQKKATSVVEAPSDVYVQYAAHMKNFNNEPLFLFTDTVQDKVLHMSIAQGGCLAYKEGVVSWAHEYDSTIKTELICNIRSCHDKSNAIRSESKHSVSIPITQITFLDYDWQVVAFGKPLLVSSSTGVNGRILEFGAGRQICKIYIKSLESYVLDVLSNSPVVIGKEDQILEEMSQESERFLEMVYSVSSTFGKLVQKFGTPDYLEGMQSFVQSLMPQQQLTKIQRRTILESFLEELFQVIRELYPEEELPFLGTSLRVLFLSRAFMLNVECIRKADSIPKDLDECRCSMTEEDEISFTKKEERAAVTIQAFFAMCSMKILKGMHQPTDKNHMLVFDTLKKLYDTIFSVTNRTHLCAKALRRLFHENHSMKVLRDMYPVYKDLKNVIDLKTFTGSVQVKNGDWVMITRPVFFVKYHEPINIKFSLFCGISKFMLRVLDNDTGKEKRRHTHSVCVAPYAPNTKGYSVVCYGWSDVSAIIPWKLCIVNMKISNDPIVIIPDSAVMVERVAYRYIPNIYNNIAKCLIKIKQNSLVTLRLSLSSNDVVFVMRCTSEDGRKYGEVTGMGNAILPVISLDYIKQEDETGPSNITLQNVSAIENFSLEAKLSKISKKSSRKLNASKAEFKSNTECVQNLKDTIYIVEAEVLYSSWPLTIDEWKITDGHKYKLLYKPLETRTSEPLQPSAFNFEYNDLSELESPYWVLEVVHDVKDVVMVENDIRRLEEIRQMKQSWYEESLDKYMKGYSLREAFLHENCAVSPQDEVDMIHVRTSTASVISEEELKQIPTCNLKDVHSINYTADALFVHTCDNKTMILHVNRAPKFNAQPHYTSHMLNPLNQAQYYKPMKEPFDEANVFLFTPEYAEKCREEHHKVVMDYKLNMESIKNDMEKYLSDQIEQIFLCWKWYEECTQESAKIMETAVAFRDKYIQQLIDEAKQASPAAKKGKK